LASSSIALLSKLLDLPKITRRSLGWYGMNWYPPPDTTFEGIKKLLPDQILHLDNLSVHYLPRLLPERFSQLSSESRTGELSASLRHIFSQIAREQAPRYVALTAGRDSRLSFALLLDAGAPFESYTMLHPLISAADIKVAAALAARYNIPHHLIPASAKDKEKLATYREHTLDYTVDADRFFYAHRSFDALDKGQLLIRSACLELGRNFYYQKLAELSWEAVKKEPEVIAERLKIFGSKKSAGEALASWCAWREEHNTAHDWRDLFYRDQRLCGWLSAVEHSLDLLERSTSLQPYACPLLFDLLLSVDQEARGSALLWERVIGAIDNTLLELPFNPPSRESALVRIHSMTRYLTALLSELRNSLAGG
jgi:hypothetical protein